MLGKKTTDQKFHYETGNTKHIKRYDLFRYGGSLRLLSETTVSAEVSLSVLTFSLAQSHV